MALNNIVALSLELSLRLGAQCEVGHKGSSLVTVLGLQVIVNMGVVDQ